MSTKVVTRSIRLLTGVLHAKNLLNGRMGNAFLQVQLQSFVLLVFHSVTLLASPYRKIVHPWTHLENALPVHRNDLNL